MALTKYFLSALAVAGIAAAQSEGNCPDTDNGVYTIQNSGDAGALQNCRTFDGHILITNKAAGNILLNGIQSITGNITVNNATDLNSLSSDQLSTIGGSFRLLGTTGLTNLQMDSLSEVKIINFEGVPNLQSLNFGEGVQKATGVRIVNTGLSSLSGIELDSVSAMEITNNKDLTEFNVNNLKEISSFLTVSFNSAGLQCDFPNLVTAADLTFSGVAGVSVPSLENVTKSFACLQTSFKGFNAANLTVVGNALVFNDNDKLTNISIPNLKSVGGGYQIANNTQLRKIDGFTKLESVGGALDFSGNLTAVNLPALNQVKGGFNMQSTGNLDCDGFNKDKNKFKGTYKCDGQLDEAKTKDGQSSSSSNGDSSSSSSKDAAPVATANVAAMGLVGAVAALVVL